MTAPTPTGERVTTPAPTLLPCPFCGGAPVLMSSDVDEWVECGRCYVCTAVTREDAAALWNARATAAPLPAAVPAMGEGEARALVKAHRDAVLYFDVDPSSGAARGEYRDAEASLLAALIRAPSADAPVPVAARLTAAEREALVDAYGDAMWLSEDADTPGYAEWVKAKRATARAALLAAIPAVDDDGARGEGAGL